MRRSLPSPDVALPLLPGAARALRLIDAIALVLAGLVAVTILVAWFVPDLAETLPEGWALMQRSTAASALLMTAGLALVRLPGVAPRVAGRSLLLAVVAIAAIVLANHARGELGGLLPELVAPANASLVTTMSARSGAVFLLLGAAALLPPSSRPPRAYALDALLLALVSFVLFFVSGHVFHATALLGSSARILISAQTTAVVFLLTTVLVARRAPYGFLSVLVRVGVGGSMARVILPIAIFVAYVFAVLVEYLLGGGAMSLTQLVATMSATLAIVLTVTIVVMARRIAEMEWTLRSMSMTDELTGVSNRRGFHLLAEQVLGDARRTKTPLLLLYFDVDGLKSVNDSLGHEVGSRLICDVARLLRASFRDNDVIGRLGGDEFALLAHARPEDEPVLLLRLDAAAAALNADPERPYRVEFSVGVATIPPDGGELLVDALARADRAMYEAKRRRKDLTPPPAPAAGLGGRDRSDVDTGSADLGG